ncbi:MAG: hypothetical protein B6D59_01830 [Campylobacteraceae bacterium 4484_4]|nr:MAG: hypothetical protein B6D59_01830 [Campylobacteraceae bacterium 4484_4]
MLKIQKIFSYVVRNIKERDVLSKYREIKDLPYESKERIEQRQLHKMNKILNYAFEHVPYYRTLLKKSGLVKNNRIEIESLEELGQIPFLTKEIIGAEQSSLHSDDIKKRGGYKNSSGGSTGVPTIFMQDREYQVNNLANFALALQWRGCGLYDSYIKLWGAERDTFAGTKPLKYRIIEFLLNAKVLNSFSMTEEDMKSYIETLNSDKPCVVIAYAQSIYELADFAEKNGIFVEKQHAIHTSAGTLYDFMRKKIEKVFQCPVFNHYGSRELGSIATECSAHNGLHIMNEQVYVEIVDKNGNICAPGEEGEIVITTLENFSMPLIRYKIGDVASMQKFEKCSCGCNYPKLEKVVGRTVDIFKTEDGKRIDGEYFTHLLYFIEGIKQFQVIQETYTKIVYKMVVQSQIEKDVLNDIASKTKKVMGEKCEVIFEFVDHIPKTKTGKYLYTISKLS